VADVMPRGVLVGYSMGARMALHVALVAPGNVTALVLVSGTPGIEDEAERVVRRTADDTLADRIEEIGSARFVDEWLANPMFAGLPEEHAQRSARAANPAAGLAGSLRSAGTGTQDNLWPRLGEITCPVLVVTGMLDAKFAVIGERMAAALPRADLRCIAGAGHTVHLEKVDDFCSALSDWFSTLR
jgi:2-succinyl-6-hydroxy-2,4-cyclohexadiene-1-carboxylate synthase